MQTAPAKRPSILCIEDNVDTCEFLAVLLAEFDLEFTHTADTALARLESSSYDLYILDNWLPDGSGIDLCRHIRHRHPDVPIVFTSGSTRDSEIGEAYRSGADRYLVKPCEPDGLKEIVKELINKT